MQEETPTDVEQPKLEAVSRIEETPETTRNQVTSQQEGVTEQPYSIPAEQIEQEGLQTEGMKLEDLKVAYVVGLTPDDNFVFELFGRAPGLVELLGIHQHACKRVDRIYDDKQVSGDRLIHEVGKAVAMLNQRLDQVLQVVAPREPDNRLG